jgi:hypothetical protein
LKLYDYQIIDGWWSKDKEGKEKLKEAKLGDTAYFQVEVKDIPVGKELTLQLFEYDYNFFIDWIDPDDDQFPEKELKKTAVVKHVGDKRIATVELLLDERWESMIKDDSDNRFHLNHIKRIYLPLIMIIFEFRLMTEHSILNHQ